MNKYESHQTHSTSMLHVSYFQPAAAIKQQNASGHAQYSRAIVIRRRCLSRFNLGHKCFLVNAALNTALSEVLHFFLLASLSTFRLIKVGCIVYISGSWQKLRGVLGFLKLRVQLHELLSLQLQVTGFMSERPAIVQYILNFLNPTQGKIFWKISVLFFFFF